MKRRVIPRRVFLVVLFAGFAIQAFVFGHPVLQDRALPPIGWVAAALSLHLLPYNLFFIAAGGAGDRLTGLAAVLLAGGVMYGIFRRFAPERLTLLETGLIAMGWVVLSQLPMILLVLST